MLQGFLCLIIVSLFMLCSWNVLDVFLDTDY